LSRCGVTGNSRTAPGMPIASSMAEAIVAPTCGRYGAMFCAHIGQADEGCDFDFLQGQAAIAEPEIH
jgi:hypothetical protein